MSATKIMKIGANYKVGGSDTKFQYNKFSIRQVVLILKKPMICNFQD
ncbi:hypothetical protein QWY99_03915 [Flavobacterium branchiarum]|uniref:Uncharacterized protein n=1 Tax=Flavobacterium branchiarum TaxID=1114870 RepID=A0ABV5FN24_9FLAO|nr:hypothetical protein [Flavobacterium branchiarum]MDN3672215.1 hypothetical protein [Flavobacterium branchiarum]